MGGWLAARSEHERPSLLFSQACCELHRRRVERPAIDRVMRLVAWARERAHEQTFERLAPQLTDERRAALDALLAASAGERTRHAWLCSRPTAVSGRALRTELEKRRFLIEEVGADRFELDGLPPNRRVWLAQTGLAIKQPGAGAAWARAPLPGADVFLRGGARAGDRRRAGGL